MKMALITAAALFATPLVAQTTPPTTPPADSSTAMQAPATQGDSTMQASPSGTADTAPMAGTAPTTAPAQAPASDGMNGGMATGAAPMAASGNLPYCRAGQFTGCREHSNAAGARVHRKRR